MLEERIGIPAVGVIPYMHVDIDDEDSLTERFDAEERPADLQILRWSVLPRISNFTDFSAAGGHGWRDGAVCGPGRSSLEIRI